MSESSMEDRLEQVLDRVIDWLKYEEAKNAALLTLDGVGLVGVILQWLGTPSEWIVLAVLLRASQAALLVSLLVALSSFYPVLYGNWLKKPACWLRERHLNGREPNVLFFGHIAGIDPEVISIIFVPLLEAPNLLAMTRVSNWTMRRRSLRTRRSLF